MGVVERVVSKARIEAVGESNAVFLRGVGGDAAPEAAQNRMFGLSGRGIFRDTQSRRRRSDGIFE